MFNQVYQNRKVLVTGHLGFKGSWLCLWLSRLGAEICGISLKQNYEYNHFELLNLKNIKSYKCDIRDLNKVKKIFMDFKPEIVFHLAAQPLVIDSYKDPINTFTSNIIGTANIFQACRYCKSVKSIVAISSDKCYQNKEQIYGYRQTDPMGGYDPYSVSKGCMELICSSYRNSFFNNENILMASARAGNVIGGGDWSTNRLIPDLIKSVNNQKNIEIRCPTAVRPWQHVLQPITGYLLLGQKLLEDKKQYAESWNFGPGIIETYTVNNIINQSIKIWPEIKKYIKYGNEIYHEANLLRLDCTKTNIRLKYKNIWNIQQTISHTINWYYNFYKNNILLSNNDLQDYINNAQQIKMEWLI